MGNNKANKGFKNNCGDSENDGLLNHHPKGLATEQKLKIAKAYKSLHALVERRQMNCIARRIDDQKHDNQNQRQGHQKGNRRLALKQALQIHGWARTRALAVNRHLYPQNGVVS